MQSQKKVPEEKAEQEGTEETKVKPQIKPETIDKLQRFMCSRDKGGELTEEQHEACVANKEMKKMTPDKSSATASTQNSVCEIKSISDQKPTSPLFDDESLSGYHGKLQPMTVSLTGRKAVVSNPN